MNANHCYLHKIGGGTLNRRVDGLAFRACPEGVTPIIDVGDRADSAKDRSHDAALANLSGRLLHVAADTSVSLIIVGYHFLCLSARQRGSLSETERTYHIWDCKVDDLGEPSRVGLLLLGGRAEH